MTPQEAIDITPTMGMETQAIAIKEEIGGISSPVMVVDSNTMTMADDRVNRASLAIKVIEEKLGPRRDAAHKLHKSITSLIAEMIEPWKADKDYHTLQIKSYKRKLEEIRQAEERRLREVARKQEEERRLADALEAEKEGNVEEAQAILEEEMFVPPPVVKVDVPKVDNRKYRTIPRARCIDKMKLIRFVAQNPALADLLDYNSSVGNNKAKSMGKEINNIPGLSYYEE